MKCDLCGCEKFNGIPGREFKNCANCGAMERHRYLSRMLKCDNNRLGKVLDIAPFSKFIYGDYLKALGCPKYVGLDKWEDGNPSDKRDVSFADVFTDVCGMEEVLGHCSFDTIIMEQVLDEIDDYQSALRSVNMVLNHGGVFFCDVAIKENFDGVIMAGQNKFGNVWKFGEGFLMNELKSIFDNVTLCKFNENGWTGHLFICLRK